MPAADAPVIAPTPYDPARDQDEKCTVTDCGHAYGRHFDWDSGFWDDEEDTSYRPGCKYCSCGSFNGERSQVKAKPGTGAYVVTFTAAGVEHVALVSDLSDIAERFGPDAVAVPASIDGPATPLPAPAPLPLPPDAVTAEELHTYLCLHERVVEAMQNAAGAYMRKRHNTAPTDRQWSYDNHMGTLEPGRGFFDFWVEDDTITEVVPMEALHPEYARRMAFLRALR